MALPANNLIMLGTSVRSFRHLEHQNSSIISDDVGQLMLDAKFVTNTRTHGGQPPVLYRILIYYCKLYLIILNVNNWLNEGGGQNII